MQGLDTGYSRLTKNVVLIIVDEVKAFQRLISCRLNGIIQDDYSDLKPRTTKCKVARRGSSIYRCLIEVIGVDWLFVSRRG